jgi:hypothetical protein
MSVPNEGIFDSAASRSLFKNKDLLRDIVPSIAPTTIGGVQKGAPLICLDDEGDFMGLVTIGVAMGLAANIISANQLIDTYRETLLVSPRRHGYISR